jgi:hypothetical protein
MRRLFILAAACVGFPAASIAQEAPADSAGPLAKEVQGAYTYFSQQACQSCHQVTVPHHDYARGLAVGRALDEWHAAVGTYLSECLRGTGVTQTVTYLGVAVGPVPDAVRRHVELPAHVGLLVETVEPSSPAEAAGIEMYDILEKLDDQLLVNPEQFSVLVRRQEPPFGVEITLIHENVRRTVSATLVEREETMPSTAVVQSDVNYVEFTPHHDLSEVLFEAIDRGEDEPTYLGVSTSPPPEAVVRQLSLRPGMGLMIDSVENGSPAEVAGLQPFDILQKLDDQILINIEQFTALVRSHQPGDAVTLAIIREGQAASVLATLARRESPSEEPAIDESGNVTPPADESDPTARFDVVSRLASNNLEFDDLVTYRTLAALRAAEAADVDDATYLRRAYLDVLGLLPSADDVASFLNDPAQDKRARLVDSLLARPEVISRLNGSASLQWTDSDHVLTLTNRGPDERHLLVQSAAGDVLFDAAVAADGTAEGLSDKLAAKAALMIASANEIVQDSVESATQGAGAQVKLDGIVPVVDFRDTPLGEVLDSLSAAAEVHLVVNWHDLADLGIDPDAPITLRMRSVKLATALRAAVQAANPSGTAIRLTVDDDLVVLRSEPSSP